VAIGEFEDAVKQLDELYVTLIAGGHNHLADKCQQAINSVITYRQQVGRVKADLSNAVAEQLQKL